MFQVKNYIHFKKSLYIIIVIILMIISAYFGFHAFEKPVFSGIHDLEFVSMDSGVYCGKASIQIANKERISISGKDIEFKMYYKNHLVAQGEANESINLAEKSISTFPVNFRLFIDSITDDMNELMKTDSIKIEVHMTGKFTFFNIRVNEKQELWLSTKKIIDASVKKAISKATLTLKMVKILEFTPSTTHLALTFNFVNTLPVSFTIDTMAFDVYADANSSQVLGTCLLPLQLQIQVNATERIESKVYIDNLNMGLISLDKLLRGSLNYYVSGMADVSIFDRKFKIPIKQHFAINPMTQSIEIIED